MMPVHYPNAKWEMQQAYTDQERERESKVVGRDTGRSTHRGMVSSGLVWERRYGSKGLGLVEVR